MRWSKQGICEGSEFVNIEFRGTVLVKTSETRYLQLPPDSLDFRPADWWNLVKSDYVFLIDCMYLFGYTYVYISVCVFCVRTPVHVYTHKNPYHCCWPIWLFATQINCFGNTEWHGKKSTLWANALTNVMRRHHFFSTNLWGFFRRSAQGSCALCSNQCYQCTLSRCWSGQAFQRKKEIRHPLCESQVVADVRY